MNYIDFVQAYVILACLFSVSVVLSVVVPALCRAAHQVFSDALDSVARDVWR